ncbi:CsbD family protein [Paraliobacillus sp. JSM ZJ581]|uniref:CsbD family protein n=1 Tax=Paraliobacillus sp. JSM ZJ581 TaxID=3342118 RepID=UPI0035A8DF80
MNERKDLSNKVKSAVSKVKGEVKDQIGNATNNPKLQAEGKKDKAKGEMQDKVAEKKENEGRENS